MSDICFHFVAHREFFLENMMKSRHNNVITERSCQYFRTGRNIPFAVTGSSGGMPKNLLFKAGWLFIIWRKEKKCNIIGQGGYLEKEDGEIYLAMVSDVLH